MTRVYIEERQRSGYTAKGVSERETEKHGVVRLVTELLPLGGFIDRRVRSGPIYPSCSVRHAWWYLAEPVRLLASLPDSPLLRRPPLNPENPPPTSLNAAWPAATWTRNTTLARCHEAQFAQVQNVGRMSTGGLLRRRLFN